MKLKQRLLVTATAVMATHTALAENPYVLGLSVAADNVEGRSVSGLIDVSFSEATSITVDAGVTQADGVPSDLNTSQWEAALTHDFGPVGITGSIGQWGDSDEFTSDNWSAGLFRTQGAWRLSANLLKRDFNLTFRSVDNPDILRTASVSADGISINLSYTAESGAGIFVSGRRYDYSQNLTRLDEFQLARLLTPTSLTLSGSFVDHGATVGGDWPIGEQLLSLNYSRDRTAVDHVDVDSLSVGWLTPLGERSDLDIGIGASRDDMDTQYFVSVLFLFYGGID